MDLRALGQSIDRGLAVLAPGWAASRAQARGMLEARTRALELARRYDAAGVGRQNAGWITSNLSPDSELRPALYRLRARSRDLTANNVWAASAVDSLQTDIVGTGILWKPRAVNGSEQLEARARALFEAWFESTRCDLRGRLNGYALQSTAVREMIEAGEFLVRRVWTGESPVPFRLLFLEADHLDTGKDGYVLEDGGRIMQGVEYDRRGVVRAYWLYKEHPGELVSSLNLTSERVPAEDVLHVFEVLRFGQSRGIPRGTPCMLRLRAFDEYENAEEMRKKVLACFVGFVHDLSPDESPTLGLGESVDEDGDPQNGEAPIRKFTPGTFQGLPAGKSISFGQPTGDDNYPDFANVTLRGVAQGYGVTYERLTGDLRGVNFSSGRMGALKYHALLDRLTWHTVVPQLCDGVWRWFTEWAAFAGEFRAEDVAATWTAPRRPMVDPSVEVPALVKAIRGGLTTRSAAVRSLGEDPHELEAEFAEENARADKLELSFDSDGRRPEQAPVVQAPEAPGGSSSSKPKPKGAG